MRALLSVYDKTGLVELAEGLRRLGFDLIASGGTASALSAAGVEHLEVAEVTGAPEILGGRVKTLHPKVHGGILADRSVAEHLADLKANDIETIDLVACNLYPFSSNPSIELIDVGGPTMVRAAAKNHAHVAVVVDPADYAVVLEELSAYGEVTAPTRRRLATAAFAHTAAYDARIADWLAKGGAEPATAEGATAERATAEAGDDGLPPLIELRLERVGELRYGENPHQHGARYRRSDGPPGFWESVVQYGGRELSYLNLFDAEAAWRLAHELLDLDGAGAAAVIVKHANPCGAAVAGDLETAYAAAYDADPMSAFGGIVALTGPCDGAMARRIVQNALADVLICRSVDEEARQLFAEKRKNMRALAAEPPGPEPVSFRQISGGFLVQETDRFLAPRASFTVASERVPTEAEWRDLELAWRVCGRTSSNAIVLAKDGQIVGVGCGQQNRVDAARLATEKAHGRAVGGAGASDAFFPFRDGLDAVCDAGVGVVVQPGGSLRDADVVAAANERGVALVLTGERHFRH